MKILLTGGNGFIGLNFIHAALRNDIHVTCIDNLCYSTKLNIDDKANKDFIFIENDIRDKGMYDFIKKNQFDAIINFAAETHVDKSIHSDIGFISTNINGVHNLISICKMCKFFIIRFFNVTTLSLFSHQFPLLIFCQNHNNDTSK